MIMKNPYNFIFQPKILSLFIIFFSIMELNWAIRYDVPNTAGGRSVKEGDIPFMAGYRNHFNSRCGGSLITKDHVLTAAHCLYRNNKPSYLVGNIIYINSLRHHLMKNTVARTIKNWTIHEQYNESSTKLPNNYDIAILTLNESVTTVEPVKLEKYCEEHGNKTGLIAGWGRTDPIHHDSYPSGLLQVWLDIITNDDCKKKQQNFRNADINDNNICTFSKKGYGALEGDSGGPLLMNKTGGGFIQVGIISYGPRVTVQNMREYALVTTRVCRF